MDLLSKALTEWRTITNVGATGLLAVIAWGLIGQQSKTSEANWQSAEADRAALREQVKELQGQLYWNHKDTVRLYERMLIAHGRLAISVEKIEKKVDAPKEP